MNATVSVDIALLRETTIRTLLAHVSAGLPCPERIEMGERFRRLRLWWDNDTAAVKAWGDALDLPSVIHEALVRVDGVLPFCSHGRQLSNPDTPVWIGWHYVDVCTYIPVLRTTGRDNA
jgi:hypothetical protein